MHSDETFFLGIKRKKESFLKLSFFLFGVASGIWTHDILSHSQAFYPWTIATIRNKNGASGKARTPNPRIRNPMLYPVELRTLERPTGVEPATLGLEGQYSTNWAKAAFLQRWSERLGLNQRPPVPKTGALPTALLSVFILYPKYIITQKIIFVNCLFFQIHLKNVNFINWSKKNKVLCKKVWMKVIDR